MLSGKYRHLSLSPPLIGRGPLIYPRALKTAPTNGFAKAYVNIINERLFKYEQLYTLPQRWIIFCNKTAYINRRLQSTYEMISGMYSDNSLKYVHNLSRILDCESCYSEFQITHLPYCMLSLERDTIHIQTGQDVFLLPLAQDGVCARALSSCYLSCGTRAMALSSSSHIQPQLSSII